MTNYILTTACLVAMLALIATPTSSEKPIKDVGEEAVVAADDEDALKQLLQSVLQSREGRSWRKPCAEGRSCIQSSARGWKRTGGGGGAAVANEGAFTVEQRGRSPFSRLSGTKCIGEGCEGGWKRTAERKR